MVEREMTGYVRHTTQSETDSVPQRLFIQSEIHIWVPGSSLEGEKVVKTDKRCSSHHYTHEVPKLKKNFMMT